MGEYSPIILLVAPTDTATSLLATSSPVSSASDLATATDEFGFAVLPTETSSTDLTLESSLPAVPVLVFASPSSSGAGIVVLASAVPTTDEFGFPIATIPTSGAPAETTVLPFQPLAATTPNLVSSSSVDPFAAPPAVTIGASADASAAIGAQAVGNGPSFGAGNRPGGGWGIPDDGNYDGQDYGDDDYSEHEDDKDDEYDDKECPSYCLKYKKDYESNEDDYSKPAKKPYSMRTLRRRQQPASGGFGAFQWPSSHDEDSEGEGEDIPDWVYDTAGKKKPSQKPKCPKSCFYKPKPKPTAKYPEDSEYTRRPAPTDYVPYPTSTDEYSPLSTDDVYYPLSTDEPWYPTSSYDPYYKSNVTSSSWTTGYSSTASESTTSETPSSDTTTWSTLVTSIKTDYYPPAPEPSKYEDGSGYYDSGVKDYTGDTLAGICPKTCNPFNPVENYCDITSSCTTTGGTKYYCACRAGYKASAWNEKDFSKQFHVPGQPYVYVAPGVVCDALCKDQTCTEVLERPKCA